MNQPNMKIKINHPTQEAIEFAHEYLKQERDEIPNIHELTPSRLIGGVDAEKIRNGEYDNTEFDIDLNEFKWMHYFILKRLLERIKKTKEILLQQLSNEIGINHQSYCRLFKTPSTHKQSFNKNPLSGGKKRSVRRSRRRARRTYRRRA
jgi:hypothetical protein